MEYIKADCCEGDYLNIEKVECPICKGLVEESKTITTDCAHQFCYSCLDKWEEKNNSCPMCRKELFQQKKNLGMIYILNNPL